MMLERISRNKKGEVHLIMVVLVIVALVLVGMIVAPVITEKMDEQAVKLDEQVSETALRLAREQNVRLNRSGKYVVYDLEKKSFVDASDAQKVTPYGNSKKHQGMVIYIGSDNKEDTSAIWDLPQNRHKYN